MQKSNETKALVNWIAGSIFFILAFIGIIGLFQALGDYYELDNSTFVFATFFTIGGLGMISQLFAYNIRTDKNTDK